ncbi:2-C-methyl-D-erythritol 4-phosphate cytidylyltransferase, partial [Patescibacteria group bacterium]|nr:2-C-methyl-D-erythritol 4-phosphate cytidylyltransferase [Patescibacteria group bacterium]
MNIALIAAAGSGKRMNSKTNKLFLPVLGKPVLYYTITAFYDHPKVDYIVLIVEKKTELAITNLIKQYFPGNSKTKKIRIVTGGNERADSVLNGFNYAKRNLKPSKKDVFLIHNGANPLVTFEEITKLIKKTKSNGACIVAHKVTDTLKEIQKTKIVKTHNREYFMRAQTPQCFTYEVFTDALSKVGSDYSSMTDEAMLAEKADYKVEILRASDHNFKITSEKDYEHLKHIMGDVPSDYLVGLGQDS